MKLRLIFSLIFVVYTNLNLFATNGTNDSLTSKCSSMSGCCINTHAGKQVQYVCPSLSDTLAYTTALINSVNNSISKQNNSISWVTVILGIYGLVIALIGLLCYRDLKEDMKAYMSRTDKTIGENKNSINDKINEYEKRVKDSLKAYRGDINAYQKVVDTNLNEFKNDIKGYKAVIDLNIKDHKKNVDDKYKNYKNEINAKNREYKEYIDKTISDLEEAFIKKIEEINAIKSTIDEEKKRIESILDGQKYHNKYLQKVNQYIFYASLVVDNDLKNQETIENIRKKAHRYYHIIVLFLPWSKDTYPAFTYIQTNGVKEDIEDLQFIADHDPDERKRKKALETIGYIRAR